MPRYIQKWFNKTLWLCTYFGGASFTHAAAAAAAAKSLQSCLTLCDPKEGGPPGSPVPGILQARTLEWVAISFSNAWKWKVQVKSLSRVQLFATPWHGLQPTRLLRPWDFPGKSTGVGHHCLLLFHSYPMVNLETVSACVFSVSLTSVLDFLTTLPAPHIPPNTDD